MARAIWSGAISFGLVNVPVKLMTAVRQQEVHFHMLHDKDGGRIQFKRVCAEDGEEVSFQHIVKGYEISKGQYVSVTPKELEALDPEATRTIDIEDFVSLDEIDPIYYEHTYYLVPDRGAAKPYALLHAAMSDTGKVAIGRMVMRTKQYLCTLRPLGRSLAVSTMQYADEVVDDSDLEGLPSGAAAKPTARELELANKLIASLSTRFTPEKYKDEYRARVLDLLERKAEGEEIVAAAPRRKPAKTVDLFEALQASLAAGERRPARAEARRQRRASPGPRKASAARGASTRRRRAARAAA